VFLCSLFVAFYELFVLLAVVFGRSTLAAQLQLRSHSQYVQRQKSDTSDMVAGNSRSSVAQVAPSLKLHVARSDLQGAPKKVTP